MSNIQDTINDIAHGLHRADLIDRETLRTVSTCKIKYTEKPIGEIKMVPDFLPSPNNLVMREENDTSSIINPK